MICQTAAVAALPFAVDGWRPDASFHRDSDIRPVRCHTTTLDEKDVCEAVLAAMEHAWDVQVDTLGFRAPILDSDDRFDVYISSQGTAGGAYVAGEGGDARPDDGAWAQSSYMVLDPTIPAEELESYVAHEFNHVLQYSTDFAEPTLPVWEATATAAEAWTLPDYKVYGPWVADFQTHTWMGLLGDGTRLWDDYGIWSYHEYGAAFWIFHLDHTHGDGAGSAGVALWEALVQDGPTNEPDVLDGWAAITGLDWQDALLEMVVAHLSSADPDRAAWVDARDDGHWGPVPYATVSTAELPAEVTASIAPTGWLHIALPDAEAGATLTLSTDGEPELVILEHGASGTVTHTGPSAELTQSGPVDVAVVSFGPSGFDADDRLVLDTLTIAIEGPVDDEPLPLDSADPSQDSGDAGDGSESASKDSGGCSSIGGLGWAWWAGLLVVARRRNN